MRVLVLSGGGGKGAYQVGVWKALRKLNIKYDVVIGTSIGSINAAFMVSKEYKKCYKLWKNVSYNDVFLNDFSKDITNKELIKNYALNAIKGGIKLDKLKSTLIKNINLNKFYNSNIDFGLVTVKLPNFKTCFFKKNDINKNLLFDYLIASSSIFPVFKIKNINYNYYLDGSYKQCLPIKYAFSYNPDEIIAVDLRMFKLRKNNYNKKNIIYITPNNKINNFYIINKKESKKALKFGYYDTLKKYNYYEGKKYTFKKNSLIKNYNKYIDSFYYCIKKYMPKKFYDIYVKKNKKVFFNNVAGKIGEIFKLKEDMVYNMFTFNLSLKIMYLKYKRKENCNSIRIILKIYKLINNSNSNQKLLNKLAYLYPKYFLCAIYLKVINKKKGAL